MRSRAESMSWSRPCSPNPTRPRHRERRHGSHLHDAAHGGRARRRGRCRLAVLFGALADPARIKVIHRLASVAPDGVCVCDPLEPLGLTQSAVSYHLKVLLQSGLVRRERRGQFNFYALRTDALTRLATVVGTAAIA